MLVNRLRAAGSQRRCRFRLIAADRSPPQSKAVFFEWVLCAAATYRHRRLPIYRYHVDVAINRHVHRAWPKGKLVFCVCLRLPKSEAELRFI
jgi:hypothetical protein